jgi:hypothetical protein
MRIGPGKSTRPADVQRAARNIGVAISAQRRIAAHQNNVTRTLQRTHAALRGPKFATKFPAARGPVTPLHKRVAEAISHSKKVQATAKAGAAHLQRYKTKFAGSTSWKPASSAIFRKQGQLHRTQSTLLARIGKALGNLFKPAPTSPSKGTRVAAAEKGGLRGSASPTRKQQRGAQARAGSRPSRASRRDPFALRPVRLTSDSAARRFYQAGRRQYDAGDFSGARRNFELALGEAGPARSSALRYNIALTHLRQGRTDRVEEISFDLMRGGHADLVARLQQLRQGGQSVSTPTSRPPVVGLSQQARRLFESGQRRYDAGDFSGARGEWNTALDMAEPPARPILRFDIGLTHLRQGNANRVDEIATELMRDGRADLARQLQQLRAGR